MSPLLLKSQENIKSAELLINNEMYSSSIHCSYYSLVQRMLCFIEPDFGTDSSEGDNAHITLLNNCAKSLAFKNLSRESISDFKSHVNQLKRTRRQADYKVQIFSKNESVQALQLSQKTQLVLNI
jgi:uncharacterized protein (UPF0332 family)